MSTKTYRAALADFVTALDSDMDALARQACLETASRVVGNTPVDTGFLRGSWQPSIGEMRDKQDAVVDPKGDLALAAIGLTVVDLVAGDVFYMTNNADYALHVEQGTSSMEARLYVKKTLDSFPQIVAEVAADLGLAK